MDGKISEQRVYCNIGAQLKFPPTEIHADLQNVYWNGALKYATVASGYPVLMMVVSQLKMTLGWVGQLLFWRKRTLLLWNR